MGHVVPPQISALPPEVRNWAMFCHVAGFAGLTGIPFANILATLIVWRMKRDLDPFVDAHGAAALNFQLSWTIYSIVGLLLVFVLIGFVVLLALAVSGLIFMIMAILASSDGRPYAYPMTIAFVKPRHG